MRTTSRNASFTSPFVTRPHHSNLYGKIERFGRFLRASHAMAGTSPLRDCVVRMVVVSCARKLRSCRGTWQRAGLGLGKARVNYAPAIPANRSPILRLIM